MPDRPGIRWSATSSATCSPRRPSFAQRLERLVARAGADDPVALAESAPQIARHGGEDDRLVVDYDDGGSPAGRLGHVWLSPL